ncbi:MAG: hypothetical protein ABUS49_06495 [Acidobacteriota bacterium]
MPEKYMFSGGIRSALATPMKIPFLIFLVSGLATLQLEPLASRGLELASQYAARQKKANTRAGALLKTGDRQILCLKEQLADVQLDLMKVLETDHTVTTRLETREAGLKYALRAEQLRQDENAQRLRKRQAGLKRPLTVISRYLRGAQKRPS